MRDEFLTAHPDAGDGPDHRDRGDDDGVLTDRGIDGTDIGPFALILFKYQRHKRFRRIRDFFVRKINAGAMIISKSLNRLDDAVDAHLQSQAVKIAITRFGDRHGTHGCSMIAHASRELVADLDTAAACEA